MTDARLKTHEASIWTSINPESQPGFSCSLAASVSGPCSRAGRYVWKGRAAGPLAPPAAAWGHRHSLWMGLVTTWRSDGEKEEQTPPSFRVFMASPSSQTNITSQVAGLHQQLSLDQHQLPENHMQSINWDWLLTEFRPPGPNWSSNTCKYGVQGNG